MNFLNFNFKKTLFFILIAALPLISINMEQKKNQNMWFAQPVGFAADVFKGLFSGLSLGVIQTTSEYLNLLRIKKENQALKSEMNAIKAQLNRFDEIQNEIGRLRNIVDFQKNTKMQLLAAQVIGRDLLPDHKTITINKGTRHGLKHMQAVITVSGAVGYTLKPSYNTSHVMLITDRYAVVHALIQKTRAHGILEGTGKENTTLQYIDRTEDVRPGDLIVTDSLDNLFPKGFPLGVVSEVERKAKSAALVVNVKPVIESHKIEEVFVIINPQSEDFLPQTPPVTSRN